MSNLLLGAAGAVAQNVYNSRIKPPVRFFGTFYKYVTFEENHTDELQITDHPIEQGGVISDHAFIRPPELILKAGFTETAASQSPLGGVLGLLNTFDSAAKALNGVDANSIQELYKKLLKLQTDRVPFEVYTGKRVYKNMLLKSLHTSTDKTTAFVLNITATFRQVFLVNTVLTQLASADPAFQKSPQKTNPTKQGGYKQLLTNPTMALGSGGYAIDPINPVTIKP